MPSAASAPGQGHATDESEAAFETAPEPGLFLTLFRDTAVVWDRRLLAVPAGDTTVRFAPVPEEFDAGAATLVAVRAPQALTVRSQPRVEIDPDGRALVWNAAGEQPGKQLLEAAYSTPQITWQARYRLHLRGPEDGDGRQAAELRGYLEIRNRSGVAFDDVRIRVSDGPRAAARTGTDAATDAATDDNTDDKTDDKTGDNTGDSTGDSHGAGFVYVRARVSLAPHSTVLIPLERARRDHLPATRLLFYDPVDRNLRGQLRKPRLRRDFGLRDEEQRRPGARAAVAVFEPGDPGHGVLSALPSGVMTVVEDDAEGAPRVLGQGMAFERVGDFTSGHVELGAASAPAVVRITRRQSEFHVDEQARRAVEEIRIALDNRDTRAHQVLVYEHMYRSRNWSVGYHNGVGAPHKLGVQTIRFTVPLAPGESRSIVYRVVYTW